MSLFCTVFQELCAVGISRKTKPTPTGSPTPARWLQAQLSTSARTPCREEVPKQTESGFPGQNREAARNRRFPRPSSCTAPFPSPLSSGGGQIAQIPGQRSRNAERGCGSYVQRLGLKMCLRPHETVHRRACARNGPRICEPYTPRICCRIAEATHAVRRVLEHK